MKSQINVIHVLLFSVALVFICPNTEAQTTPLKRPKSKVGVSSVDNFVTESFDIYDKVYKYDGYNEAGTPLEEDDIDILEDALDDLNGLTDSAPDILGDLGGLSILKQGKATLQINKAKKALKYSIKTAKELLLGQRERDTNEEETENDSDDTITVNDQGTDSNHENDDTEKANISDNLEVYSKFDFVPGDKMLFYDDFSQDFIGDFPSKWNTNASGEVVRIGDKGNWFELKSGYGVYFIPDLNNLPKDYTIEFDILTKGLGRKTSSTAQLFIILSDDNKFKDGTAHYAYVSIPVGQYGAFPLRAKNYFNRGGGEINANIKADIRNEVLNKPHISISVTKNRYRLWVNEVKYVDIPRFIEELNVLNYLKFHINNFKDGEEHLYISNLKVLEGGVDLRRKLLSEGKISTNGILFDSGSANIQPQSLGIIRQISQVLMQDENIKLNIVGHTDADGTEESNLKLSKARAAAVKEALISIYKISGHRLQTNGKGESVPIADNTTNYGKAQNRRVEFIKI